MTQLDYSDSPEVAFSGMQAEPYSLAQIDSGLASGAIGLGVAVKQVAGAGNDDQFEACVADDAVYGISIFDGAKEQASDGSFSYADKDDFPVMRRGRVWMKANAEIAKGAAVAFDPASGKVGAVSGGTTTLAFGIAQTYAAADEALVIVELDF